MSPGSGCYTWNRQDGGGVLVRFRNLNQRTQNEVSGSCCDLPGLRLPIDDKFLQSWIEKEGGETSAADKKQSQGSAQEAVPAPLPDDVRQKLVEAVAEVNSSIGTSSSSSEGCSSSSAGTVLHWRFEWLRTTPTLYPYGCKFTGNTGIQSYPIQARENVVRSWLKWRRDDLIGVDRDAGAAGRGSKQSKMSGSGSSKGDDLDVFTLVEASAEKDKEGGQGAGEGDSKGIVIPPEDARFPVGSDPTNPYAGKIYDYQSSFRIQPHRMGFVKRYAGDHPAVELNYPGIYKIKAWCSSPDGKRISKVSETIYEVLRVSSHQKVGALPDRIPGSGAPVPGMPTPAALPGMGPTGGQAQVPGGHPQGSQQVHAGQPGQGQGSAQQQQGQFSPSSRTHQQQQLAGQQNQQLTPQQAQLQAQHQAQQAQQQQAFLQQQQQLLIQQQAQMYAAQQAHAAAAAQQLQQASGGPGSGAPAGGSAVPQGYPAPGGQPGQPGPPAQLTPEQQQQLMQLQQQQLLAMQAQGQPAQLPMTPGVGQPMSPQQLQQFHQQQQQLLAQQQAQLAQQQQGGGGQGQPGAGQGGS